MPIKRIKQFKEHHAPKGSFKANMLTLMTGTVVAQLITVAISPVLTRLFSPSAFGIYGVYLSLVSIMIAVVTLRYDQALMLPKDNQDAAALFWVSFLSVIVFSITAGIVCLVFSAQILVILKTPELGGWLFFLPFSVLFGGAYLTLNSWSTRQKQFHRASVSQAIRATAVSGVQLSFGALHAGSGGLISGAVLGDLVSSFVLGVQVRRDDFQVLKKGLSWQGMKTNGRHYADFPLFSSTQNLLNAVSQNIPLLLLAKFFGSAVVGFYALGVRVIQFPMTLIQTSLRQVLFQTVSEVYNAGGDTYVLFRKTTLGLIAVVIVPASIIILFGPVIFGFVLGKEWVVAGEYARWLVLWLAVSFINPPSTQFFQVYRKQEVLMFFDLILLLLRITVLTIGGLYLSPLQTIIIFSVAGAGINIFIVAYAWAFLRKTRLSGRKNES